MNAKELGVAIQAMLEAGWVLVRTTESEMIFKLGEAETSLKLK